MDTTQKIIAILIPAATLLGQQYQGYQNRRQQRQIELHKLDPQKHPLTPPPNPLAQFFLKHWGSMIFPGSFVLNSYLFYRELFRPIPLTRGGVVLLMLPLLTIAVLVSLEVTSHFMNRAFDLQLETTKRMLDVLAGLHKRLGIVEQGETKSLPDSSQ